MLKGTRRAIVKRIQPISIHGQVSLDLLWTDPVAKFIGLSTGGRRIIGVAADVDDENVVPGPAMTVYHPLEQEFGGGRLFVYTKGDPYALVPPVTKLIRDLSPDQPVERASTLEDVRAEVLAPNRLNALVFGGFAGVALMIAVVGVAGVLAFSVSARTREFGVRLAIGSEPRQLLQGRFLPGRSQVEEHGVLHQDVHDLHGRLPDGGAQASRRPGSVARLIRPSAASSRRGCSSPPGTW